MVITPPRAISDGAPEGSRRRERVAIAVVSGHCHGAGHRRTSKLPRLGLSLPARILRAVDLPMPLVPTRPSTWPGRGTGSLVAAGGEGGCQRPAPFECSVSGVARRPLGPTAVAAGGPHRCSLNELEP